VPHICHPSYGGKYKNRNITDWAKKRRPYLQNNQSKKARKHGSSGGMLT
jgi:hypothetical protein